MGNKQLQTVKDAINHPEDEQKIIKLFNSYDKDRSGYLEEAEFDKFVSDIAKMFGDGTYDISLSAFDKDGDAEISYYELKQGLLKMTQ
eukprot:gene9474-1679_t